MIILHLIAQVALQSVSIVKLMVCHILIDKPNQVHKHTDNRYEKSYISAFILKKNNTL